MDVRNFAGEKLGRRRLEESVRDLVAKEPIGAVTASRVIDHLMWTVRQFAGLMPKPDDITIVVLCAI